MLNKNDVINFFDELSIHWDDEMILDENKIEKILDYAGIGQGLAVLDVACGTGVLIPFYLNRKVKKVTGVDISPKMIEIAKEKYITSPEVEFFIGDMEGLSLDQQYDAVVLYNAFPHFINPKRLVKQLADHLKEGGILCIAHGMSRAQIDSRHKGRASRVSNGLIHEDEMEKLFQPYFDVHVKVSNQEMYVVAGKKRVV